MLYKNFLLISILVLYALTIIVLAVYGNTSESYNDIIVEWTSILESHKTVERYLIYCLALGMVLAYFLFEKIKGHNNVLLYNNQKKRKKDITLKNTTFFLFMLVFLNILIKGEVSLFYIFLFLTVVFVLFQPTEKKDLLISYIFTVYGIYSLYCIYAFMHGHVGINYIVIFLLSFFVTIILSGQNIVTIRRYNLVAQLIIPFVLLCFICSDYKYKDVFVKIKEPNVIRWIAFISILIFIYSAVSSLRKFWKGSGFAEYITIGTLISILFFTGITFPNDSAIISPDLHHPFENMIGYSQVFELKQKLFESYVPVSGMYSIFEGFIDSVICNGTVSQINSAHVFFEFLVCVVVGVLLKYNFSNFISLIIVVLAYFWGYNRIYFILPIMLLLSNENIISKTGLWLKVWLLSSLIYGLYYPVYGAACCLGFLPLAVVEFFNFRSITQKNKIKSAFNIFSWIIVLSSIVFSWKLLFGTLRHVMAMGSQTIFADGLSKFGQIVPNWFFPYLNSDLRTLLMYGFTFIVPSLFIVTIFSFVLNKKFISKKIENKRISLSFLAIVIMLLISFSYSTVRLDVNTIYDRSFGPMYAAIISGLALGLRHCIDNYKLIPFVVVSAIVITSDNFSNVNRFTGELNLVRNVPSNYIRVNSTESDYLKKIGNGFINRDMLDSIKNYSQIANSLGNEPSCGALPLFGLYYIYEKKGVSTIESLTIKGKKAVDETVDILLKHKAPSNVVDVLSFYRLFNFLLTSGKYIWNPKKGYFVYNSDNLNIKKYNLDYPISKKTFFGYNPSSFGSSYNSLKDLFKEYTGKFVLLKNSESIVVLTDKPISDENCDFIYLVLDNPEFISYARYDMDGLSPLRTETLSSIINKKIFNKNLTVEISYDIDGKFIDSSINCEYSRGKLLIPLGAGYKWLLHDHSKIQISIISNGKKSIPNIKEVKFLKLKNEYGAPMRM